MKICSRCKINTPDKMMVQNGKNSWCKLCASEHVARFRSTTRGAAYNVYNNMLRRCYDKKSSRYLKYGGAGVIVADEWLGDNGFEAFFIWYSSQKNSENSSYQLDKDIYCNANNIKPHVYSSETCQFVSRSENQRNYSSLLINNTSGFTGVTLNKNKTTWDFRLSITNGKNINRSGFMSSLEAAKARETFIIVNSLDYKLEHVGTTMKLDEGVKNYSHYASSNYNGIRKAQNKYTGVVMLNNGKRQSIGTYNKESEAAEARNKLIDLLSIKSNNNYSFLFGFEALTNKDIK